MRKLFFATAVIVLLLSSCTDTNVSDLSDENIETFEVTQMTAEPVTNDSKNNDTTQQTGTTENQPTTNDVTLDDKMASIDFAMVSGYYTRNVVQEGVEYMEMFSFDKSNFIRIAQSDIEREVYAYNYLSDDFTYMYYFDGELTSKAVFNISTGAILEDSDGLTELLKVDAEELKLYFNTLLDEANLTTDEFN